MAWSATILHDFARFGVPEIHVASYLPSALTGPDHQRVLSSARNCPGLCRGGWHSVLLYQPLCGCRINQRGIDFCSVLLAELFKGTVSDKRVQDLQLASRNPALHLRYRYPQ